MIEASPAPGMTAAMEDQSLFAAPVQSLRDFAGRISSGLRNGYEAIRDMPRSLKTYAAIGATAVTLFVLANAETAHAETDPLAGENVPTLLTGSTPLSNSLEASASTVTQQKCISEAVARPGIVRTEIIHAGTPGAQEAFAHINNDAMDSGCNDLVLQKEEFKFKVGGHAMEPIFMTFHIGNEGGSFTAHQVIFGTRGLYECSPRAKTTPAEVDIKEIAQDPQTQTPLATKIYKAPIQKIFPKAC